MLESEITFIVQCHCGRWHWHSGKTGIASYINRLYCIVRHVGFDHGRSYEIEQSAVKCMRGILFCYMRQANKV